MYRDEEEIAARIKVLEAELDEVRTVRRYKHLKEGPTGQGAITTRRQYAAITGELYVLRSVLNDPKTFSKVAASLPSELNTPDIAKGVVAGIRWCDARNANGTINAKVAAEIVSESMDEMADDEFQEVTTRAVAGYTAIKPHAMIGPVARRLCWIHSGVVLGSGALYLAGKVKEKPRDLDIVIPLGEWPTACLLIPEGAKANSFGGFKFKEGVVEVDVWVAEPITILNTRGGCAYSPKFDKLYGEIK